MDNTGVPPTEKGEPPKWFPKGNSFAQDEARRAARAAIAALTTEAPHD